MSEKAWKILKRLLICASILATLKIIFFDYTMDEEYQIVMAYRNLQGDSLFKEMWEPHQTSAFMCIGLMWFYHLITGTYTGVVLFLRVCTTAIQALLAVWGYKVMKRFTQKEYAFLLGIAYFNFVPKNIQIPEFSNMQVWFFSVLILALLEYDWVLKMTPEAKKANKWWIVLAAVSTALEILAYPSCLLLFPVFVIYILLASGKDRIKDCFIYIGTCVLCGALWLLFILRKVPFAEFVTNVGNVFSFDLTHEVSGATDGKFSGIVNNLIGGACFLFIIALISCGIYYFINRKEKKNAVEKNKGTKCLQLMTIAICVSELVQIVYWVIVRKGFEFPHIHVVVIWIAAAFAWKEAGKHKKLLIAGLVGMLVSFVAVVYISDLQIYNALPHCVFGIILCVLLIVMAWEKQTYVKAGRWITLLLIATCITVLVGKGYTFRSGREYYSVFDTRGIMKHGPAVGIMADYMCAYIYNSNYEDFKANIEEGEQVMIVTNMVFSAGTTPYMFQEAEICHYSIVDPTAYDERLIEYWTLYPDKAPDVIVVDCWYGQLMEPADNYIMTYIEEEFDYTEVIDGKYVRFYKK
ncbi:MAG: hypothetical protein IJZ42_08270 [Lachnospiraceae bacterium]|nr:hypothetical protein [Lachnospiraceae bacterium]